MGRRYRLYPAIAQAARPTAWGHTCRWIWNTALAQRQMVWATYRHTLRAPEQCAHLTVARDELEWVADLPAQAGQQVLRRLDRAYDAWWRTARSEGPPRFKKRGARLSVTFP